MYTLHPFLSSVQPLDKAIILGSQRDSNSEVEETKNVSPSSQKYARPSPSASCIAHTRVVLKFHTNAGYYSLMRALEIIWGFTGWLRKGGKVQWLAFIKTMYGSELQITPTPMASYDSHTHASEGEVYSPHPSTRLLLTYVGCRRQLQYTSKLLHLRWGIWMMCAPPWLCFHPHNNLPQIFKLFL